jgi:hypothetical protein
MITALSPKVGVPLLLSLLFLSCETPTSSEEDLGPDPFAGVQDSAMLLGAGSLSSPLPEFATSWNPDLNLLVFNRTDESRQHIHIFFSSFEDGAWTLPQRVPFSDTGYLDIDPFLYGDRMIFSSNRTGLPDSVLPELDLFYSDYQGGNWTDPKPLESAMNSPDTEIFLTATRKGEAYLSRFQARTRLVSILKADLNHAQTHPVEVSFANDTARLTNPAIAPDGSFMVVASGNMPGFGTADLFVSFPTGEGDHWTAPVNLGPKVNSEFVEFAPGISPDGRYLFFASERPGVVQEGMEGGRPPGDLYVISLPGLIEEARKEIQ